MRTGGWRERQKERYYYRIALLTPCQEQNWVSGHLPLLFGSLWLGCVFLHLAPGCVLKVLSKACVSKLHGETKGEKSGAQIKAYFLRFLCDSSLTFLLLFCKEQEEKKTKHSGAKLVSPLFVTLFYIFH